VPGPAPLTVDVHILAATTADLERLVREGRIREDLSYRLSGMRLQLPPLRERREEIRPSSSTSSASSRRSRR
jgi:propionate catabolism operon transcriptional regulator